MRSTLTLQEITLITYLLAGMFKDHNIICDWKNLLLFFYVYNNISNILKNRQDLCFFITTLPLEIFLCIIRRYIMYAYIYI